MVSISQSIDQACQLLGNTSTSPRIDAQVLLCHVLQCNTAYLATWPGKNLSASQDRSFNALIRKRLTGMPVAYLIDEKEFWSLKLKVSQDTLIPRPETELLVETVLSMFQREEQLDIIDLGTGTGAIAIALASERPDWKVTATDISGEALAISKHNAERHSIKNITFITSDWFGSLGSQTFDIVISNPPYIAEHDTHLEEGDVRFEPQNALVSGNMGMDDILKITEQSTEHLNDGGWLVMEHGYDQKKLVSDCLHGSGFISITQKNDLSGNPRLTIGQYKKTSV